MYFAEITELHGGTTKNMLLFAFKLINAVSTGILYFSE
jgi:hypothetical protein